MFLQQAYDLIELAQQRGIRIVTVESCTGGLIASLLTEIPGASAVFDCGLVTYSNESKTELAGVSAELLHQFGAVSAETAGAMAEGGLQHSRATLSVAVTGVAGPDGGSAAKPVGTIWLASAFQNHPTLVEKHFFSGNRSEIRQQSVQAAIKLLVRQLSP